DKVAGLVLCAAAPRMPVAPELLAVIEGDYPRFPAWLAARALSPSAKPPLRRAFEAAGLVAPREVTLADFEAVAATDLGPRLPSLRCPVAWLDGADDAVVTDPRPERPGTARALPGVGHLVPIEAPADVAAATLEMALSG